MRSILSNDPGLNRTADLPLRRRPLYPLSYWTLLNLYTSFAYVVNHVSQCLQKAHRHNKILAVKGAQVLPRHISAPGPRRRGFFSRAENEEIMPFTGDAVFFISMGRSRPSLSRSRSISFG